MLRTTFLATALCALAGCQLLPRQPIEEPEPPVVLGPPTPADAPQQPARLVDAMDRIQNGRFDEAASMLAALREASPGSPTLALLARQLEAPPEELLPGPYRSLSVQPGDTLSEIAERELGNPLLFVALARLNGIDVPRSLSVGDELRVPAERPRASARPPLAPVPEPEAAAAAATTVPGPPVEEAEPVPAEAPVERRSELETVAEYLLASGQPTDARELLLAAARDSSNSSNRSLTPRAERLLVELSLDASQAEAEDGQYDAAIATLAQVAGALAPGPSRSRLEVRRTRIEVQSLLERSRSFQERGLMYEAYRLAEDALILDGDYAPAVALEEELRTTLVETYHDRALRAWRSRDIDLAIRTWRELLDIVPEFEPAAVYLERAERLRARLADPQ